MSELRDKKKDLELQKDALTKGNKMKLRNFCTCTCVYSFGSWPFPLCVLIVRGQKTLKTAPVFNVFRPLTIKTHTLGKAWNQSYIYMYMYQVFTRMYVYTCKLHHCVITCKSHLHAGTCTCKSKNGHTTTLLCDFGEEIKLHLYMASVFDGEKCDLQCTLVLFRSRCTNLYVWIYKCTLYMYIQVCICTMYMYIG